MLPINYLNHFSYCPRRFWLMYAQGEIAVNAPMLEGNLLHNRADTPGRETDDKGRNVNRRVWVWSERLGIAGFADFVEENEENYERGSMKYEREPLLHTSYFIPHTSLVPVEYKHGRKGKWDNDQIQLCAQALCLEEMTGERIEQGEIFYWRSRRRVTVAIDEELRALTEATILQARDLMARAQIPLPISEKEKCKHCSMEPICLPNEVRKLGGMKNEIMRYEV